MGKCYRFEARPSDAKSSLSLVGALRIMTCTQNGVLFCEVLFCDLLSLPSPHLSFSSSRSETTVD